MNAPTPTPDRFSLADWGVLVAIVTTITGAFYAIWRVAVMPLLLAFARRLLHRELDTLTHNSTAIGQVWTAQIALQATVDDMKPKVDRIPIIEALLVESVAGGRRKNDHR